MTSTSLIMTKRKDASKLVVWDAPPNDLVKTVLKEIRVVPIEMLDEREKFGFILWGPIRGNVSGGKVIDNDSEPRRSRDGKEMFIRK